MPGLFSLLCSTGRTRVHIKSRSIAKACSTKTRRRKEGLGFTATWVEVIHSEVSRSILGPQSLEKELLFSPKKRSRVGDLGEGKVYLSPKEEEGGEKTSFPP